MRISDLVKMGLRNLSRRKARTALTVIGVVIGTISIIVMVSIGIGMNKSFTESVLENGGMTIINVSKWAGVEDENGNWQSKDQQLNDELVEQLRQIEHVNAVSPVLYPSIAMKCGKYEGWASFNVMDVSTLESFGYAPLEDGTYPSKEDKTFYIGPEAIRDFQYYAGRSPQIKKIDLKKDKVTMEFNGYQVNEKKKPFVIKLDNYKMFVNRESTQTNYSIFIDIDYYKELFMKYVNTLKLEERKKALTELNEYGEIQINVDNMNNVVEVQNKIKELGFQSNSSMQYIEPMKKTSEMLQMILGAIGAIAMLVSAINIANTMVMSIYERTKEIGVMKVLGCLVTDVKKLFLFESAMIGLIGGIVGIGLSYFASFLLNTYGGDLFKSLMQGSGGMVTTEGSQFSIIPMWLPFAAALFGMLVGIISGYVPARRATKISAIEAMKTEG